MSDRHPSLKCHIEAKMAGLVSDELNLGVTVKEMPEEMFGRTLVIFDDYVDWEERSEVVSVQDAFKK